MAITFSATGIPRPQPRPRIFRGRAVSTADPKARAWSDAIVRAAHPAGPVPLGPVSLVIEFRMPTKDSKRHGLPHTHVPDADNLAKLALDALQRAGTLANDSAVSSLSVRKVWASGDQAGASFLLEPDGHVPLAQPSPSWLKA